MEDSSSFLEGRGAAVPEWTRRRCRELGAAQRVCRSPASSSAQPGSHAAAVPKVEAGARSQIGFAQRGTGCSGAGSCSRFAAGKVQRWLAAGQPHAPLATLAAELGSWGWHDAADEEEALEHVRAQK